MPRHSLTSQGEEASNHAEEDQHLGSAEGEKGEDEADNQDDEATEECGGRCPSPRCEQTRQELVPHMHQMS